MYTVTYLDNKNRIVETEVWRFKNQIDMPSHRVLFLKLNGEIVWDKSNKFSSI
jgi:hypothetical protein